MRVSAFRDSGCKMTVSAQGTDASFKNFVVGGAATGTGTAAAPVASDPPLASMWNGALSYTAAASFFVPATATITGVATTETAATIAYTISGDMAAGSQCELVVKQTGARIASPCAAGANSIAAAGLASGTSYDFSVTGTGATGATFVSAEVPGTTKVVIQDVTLFDALGAPTTGEFTCSRNNSRGPASWAIQPFVVPSGVKTLTAVTVGVGASDGFTVMIQRGGSAIWSVRAPGGFDQNASFAASIPVTPGETLELWVGDASGWTNGGTRSPSQLFSVVRALGDYIQGGDYRTTNACQGQAPGAQTFSGTDMSAKIVGRTG